MTKIEEIKAQIEAIKTQLEGNFFNISLQMELARLEMMLEDHTDPRQ
jgi:hypothetical protein